MRRAIEELIPQELQLSQVNEVPIWGDGRCMIHAMEASSEGLAVYQSVPRETEADGSPGKPLSSTGQAAVSSTC